MKISDISWEAELDLNIVLGSVHEAINTKKLFRYQFKKSESSVNILEQALNNYVKTKFSLGVSSATNAIFLALKSSGVTSTSKVLIPAFTFTAVPSAVIQCGAEPVLVDITENYVVDLKDLELKIIATGAKYFLISHMRGHLCDMPEVVRICEKHSVILIEDAAHALGVTWNGKHAGTFGLAGIYSFQSYKIINAGEGGMLVTNDPDIFWKSVFMSGSYENNYQLHSSEDLNIAEKYKNKLPVFNVRMNNITAALAIPQLLNIESTISKVNKNYDKLVAKIKRPDLVIFPIKPYEVRPVRDSAQMRIMLNESCRSELKIKLNQSGVPISYFGGVNNSNARLYQNWKFLASKNSNLTNTKRHLEEVFDLRLPIHFTIECVERVSDIFLKVLEDL